MKTDYRLIEMLDAVEFARRRLGFDADETQARVLRCGARQVMLNCPRQWGKSTVTAILAVHHALVHRGGLVIAGSPSARQSGEFIRKCKRMLGRLGMKAKGDGENRMSAVLPNGSRIVGLPGNEGTVRGFSNVTLLVIDEAAQASNELYWALRPMVAMSGGAIWLMSTPRGARGFFWSEWTRGVGWERIAVRAWECSRYKKEFLERERASLVDEWFQQEYGCAFVSDETQVFPHGLVDGSVTEEVEPVWG